jgi:hypothetical protein
MLCTVSSETGMAASASPIFQQQQLSVAVNNTLVSSTVEMLLAIKKHIVNKIDNSSF